MLILQPDRVTEFCKKNKLQLIIRAHECVMAGFERFAQGQLITLFSATNYCGKEKQESVKNSFLGWLEVTKCLVILF